MATIRVEYCWASGDSVNIYIDSDLETTEQLCASAAAMWRETWGSLEPAAVDDGRAAAPDA